MSQKIAIKCDICNSELSAEQAGQRFVVTLSPRQFDIGPCCDDITIAQLARMSGYRRPEDTPSHFYQKRLQAAKSAPKDPEPCP